MTLNFNSEKDASRWVLVVDDDPVQREFASVYLAASGTKLETASSARAALAALERENFDIVLIDFEMPGMNGLELIGTIRANPRWNSLALMMVTGHEDVATIDAAFKAGATSFFTKPVNWRLLSFQIDYVLRAHKSKAP